MIPQPPVLRRLLPAAFTALLLVIAPLACSSGGDSPTEPGSGGGPSVAAVEGTLVMLINDARRDRDRTPLVHDPALAEVARRHSERMRDEGFFDHMGPTGGGPADRVRAAGISFRVLGENIGTVSRVSRPANRAHQAFMENPSHRGNILDLRFSHVGVGVARQGDTYWITELFLRP